MKNYITTALGLIVATGAAALLMQGRAAHADCSALPSHDELKTALTHARQQANGGFNLDMWGTIVDRHGRVCAIAYTGQELGDQWPGSRTISMSKAYTANHFSLKGLSLSTANLYAATQPGGPLFGLQEGNPLDEKTAYDGNEEQYGTPKDHIVGKKVGGNIVFGGGLALYDDKGKLLGGLGVSGDSSCADHNIAWRTRNELKLDYLPQGSNDQIKFDIDAQGKSASAFGHPTCNGESAAKVKDLPPVRTVSI